MADPARKRILVADDDELVLIDLEAQLESEGYDTTTVWSSHGTVELLRNRTFDLVLLDEFLQGVACQEILSLIETLPARPRVIILSATSPTPDTVRSFRSLGVSDVVWKRGSRAQILDAIRSSLPLVPSRV